MLFSTKSENLKLASRSRDYMRKSTIENLKTCQPREQNKQLSFDKETRLKSKHAKKSSRFRVERKVICFRLYSQISPVSDTEDPSDSEYSIKSVQQGGFGFKGYCFI